MGQSASGVVDTGHGSPKPPRRRKTSQKPATFGPKVLARLEEMPPRYRSKYQAAMRGRSRTAAIGAFCQMCVGWNSPSDVRGCTDPACPLYPYRPYQ